MKNLTNFHRTVETGILCTVQLLNRYDADLPMPKSGQLIANQ